MTSRYEPLRLEFERLYPNGGAPAVAHLFPPNMPMQSIRNIARSLGVSLADERRREIATKAAMKRGAAYAERRAKVPALTRLQEERLLDAQAQADCALARAMLRQWSAAPFEVEHDYIDSLRSALRAPLKDAGETGEAVGSAGGGAACVSTEVCGETGGAQVGDCAPTARDAEAFRAAEAGVRSHHHHVLQMVG